MKNTTVNQILDFHSQGKTNIEILELINDDTISIKNICSLINRKGLNSNKHKEITITNELNNLIIGSMLGDGHITKEKNYNSKLSLAHSIKQESYLKYKFNILKKYELVNKFCKYKIHNNRYKNGFIEEVRFKSKAHPIFSNYRDIFYKNNVKYIPNKIEELDEFGLSIWYFDDGNKTKYGYQLNTQNFTITDIKKLSLLLKTKFNINNTIHKNKTIYILSDSKDILTNILNKYSIPCVDYKIHRKTSPV